MCCLKYEQDFYEVTLKKLPKVGRDIMTPDGIGTVTEIAVIREKVKVRIRQQDDTYDIREYSLDQVCKPGETLPEQPEGDEGEMVEDLPEAEPTRQMPHKNAPRPPRQPRGQNPKDGEATKEQDGRRRYPRPKGKKQSAEQYFERNMSGEDENRPARAENAKPAAEKSSEE